MRQAVTKHWFYPVALLVLLLAWASWRITPVVPGTDRAALTEAALIFDALVSLPLLYWLCLRTQQTMRTNIAGMIAVACCGLWLAGWIVPLESQVLLPQLSWMRPVVLTGLLVVELRLAIALFRLVFRNDTKVQELHDAGVPPLMARLMLAEARFWRRVWSIFRK